MSNPVQLGALSTERPTPYVKPRIKLDRAAWLVGGKGFYDDNDKLWTPGSSLYFDGVPNQDLHPLNKVAYDAMQLFLDELDRLGSKKAKAENKAFIAKERAPWLEDGEMEELPSPESVMGVKKTNKNEAIR